MDMPSTNYECSKGILPGSERPDFKYLHMIRERDVSTSLVFRLFASKFERPAMIEVGDVVFYPEKFSDARKALEVFFSVDSFDEFIDAVKKAR